MCVRLCPLMVEEAEAVLDARESGARTLDDVAGYGALRDARPGATIPVFVPRGGGTLAVEQLTWGFPLEGKPDAVFNTRIETALRQLQEGRRGMWVDAVARGRCLLPVRAFFGAHLTERVPSERTGRPVRRQYRFRMPGARAFLLAAVREDGRFSVVTTAPNASVAPVHDRMPLVLGPGESRIWLGPYFGRLADRSDVRLVAEPER